ncbi:MAG: inverse autotransporter beta domain-containing protein [Verrucomicrobia bacterium]|nr:inverse autotransporter beta domain-containing protein [Verrucomicrobiota bacterium]
MFRFLLPLLLAVTSLVHPHCYSTSGLGAYQLPCPDTPHPFHLDGNGLFWNDWRRDGNATLFLPLFQPGLFVFFLQGSAGRFVEQWAVNVGGGVRGPMGCGCGWGLNCFADYAYSDSTLSWWQGGLGAELFGGWWEVRVNGYVPQTIEPRSSPENPAKHPNRVIRTDVPLAGFDSEGGLGVCIGPGALWGYAGYFRFVGQEEHPLLQGPRLRLEYQINIPFCWADGEAFIAAEWENTKRLGNQTSLYIHFSLPLGNQQTCRYRMNSYGRQSGRSVRRQNGIVLFTTATKLTSD